MIKITRKVYISRNYKKLDCGGSIARTDIETVMDRLGFVNIGLPQSVCHNGIYHGIKNYVSYRKALRSIRPGDMIVLQYPMKIGFDEICGVSHKKGAKIVCLIHDLSSFREKTLTPEEEICRLNQCDVLLTHNHRMREWLSSHGCRVKMIDFEIMDYIHGASGNAHEVVDRNYSLFYVGDLSPATYGYIYDLARIMPQRDIYLYGHSPSEDLLAELPNLHFEGFAKDTDLMKSHKGDFGLSWYGTSLDFGIGKIGEYMEYNNPHKISLYFRCNSPVVVWSKGGRAKFIKDNHLGICVDSLRNLESRLSMITADEYREMVGNVERVNERLKNGRYLEDVLQQAEQYLLKQT